MRDLSKFKGCLIGGAVGDALGYAVEFMPASTIFQKYGKKGITEYELRHGVAEISDPLLWFGGFPMEPFPPCCNADKQVFPGALRLNISGRFTNHE